MLVLSNGVAVWCHVKLKVRQNWFGVGEQDGAAGQWSCGGRCLGQAQVRPAGDGAAQAAAQRSPRRQRRGPSSLTSTPAIRRSPPSCASCRWCSIATSRS